MWSGRKQKMSQQEISEAEVQIIRWGEKILTPLLIAGFIGIVSYLSHVGTTMAQLATEHNSYNATNGDVKKAITSLDEKIESQVKAQQQIEITVQRIDTSQQNLKEQMNDLKSQNAEIIRLLRRD